MTVIQDPTQKCDFKEKFRKLWNRAFSSIRTINGKGTEDAEGSVTLTAEDLPDVQPLLTAGENITIEDNVISATGGGSAPVWGNITGTLEDQTDLKNALDGKAGIYDTYTKDETDVLMSYKADVSSVEAIEDEIGAVGQAGTIRNDISLVNDRVDSVEDEIGPETTAGTLRYKIEENSNDIISIENEIDIIDGIIASHSTAINGKADKTYVDAHIANTSNPHMVSKAQVGLSNVDNTSDANKPISTATQAALNDKADVSALDQKRSTKSIWVRLADGINGVSTTNAVKIPAYTAFSNYNGADYFENYGSGKVRIKKRGSYRITIQAYGKLSSPGRIQCGIGLNSNNEYGWMMDYIGIANENMGVEYNYTMTLNVNDIIFAQVWSNYTWTFANNSAALNYFIIEYIGDVE